MESIANIPGVKRGCLKSLGHPFLQCVLRVRYLLSELLPRLNRAVQVVHVKGAFAFHFSADALDHEVIVLKVVVSRLGYVYLHRIAVALHACGSVNSISENVVAQIALTDDSGYNVRSEERRVGKECRSSGGRSR